MATFTQEVTPMFPLGTSLTIRPRSNYDAAHPPVPGQAPLGAATATATSDASTGVVTFTGLASDTDYVITDASGSRYLAVRTRPSEGVLQEAFVEANQAGIAAEADVTGLSITFTVRAGKTVSVKGRLPLTQQVTSAGQQTLKLTDASNVAKDTTAQNVLAAQWTSLEVEEVISTPGTYTRKLRLAATAGTVTIWAAATGRAYLRAVEQ